MKESDSERRRFIRFLAKEGTMVFLGKRIGQILNISMKGLSFRYVTTQLENGIMEGIGEKQTEMADIIYGKEDFYLHKIPVRVINEYDFGHAKIWDRKVLTLHCSLMFEDLSPDQLFLLKRFLLLNTSGIA